MESAICSALLPFVGHMAVGMKHAQHALLLDGLLMDSHIYQMNDPSKLPDLVILYYFFFFVLSGWFSEIEFYTASIFTHSLTHSLFLSLFIKLFKARCQLQTLPSICPVAFVFQSSPLISSCFSLSCLLSMSCIHNQPAVCLVNYSAFFTRPVFPLSISGSASCAEMRWTFCLLLWNGKNVPLQGEADSLSICFAVMHSIDS